MQQTFEHLLGLRVETALAILSGYGIVDVSIVPTEAPVRPPKAPRKPAQAVDDAASAALTVERCPADDPASAASERRGETAIADEPSPSDAARAAQAAIQSAEAIRHTAADAPRATLRERLGGCFQWGAEQPAPDALKDEIIGDALLSARVVAVRDDGRTLVVSRFHVGDPPRAAHRA